MSISPSPARAVLRSDYGHQLAWRQLLRIQNACGWPKLTPALAPIPVTARMDRRWQDWTIAQAERERARYLYFCVLTGTRYGTTTPPGQQPTNPCVGNMTRALLTRCITGMASRVRRLVLCKQSTGPKAEPSSGRHNGPSLRQGSLQTDDRQYSGGKHSGGNGRKDARPTQFGHISVTPSV